jgi:hypothetical protein
VQRHEDFRSNATPNKCCERPKNGSNSIFATIFVWLNVVALVTVAIGECNGLRFSCDTYPLFATLLTLLQHLMSVVTIAIATTMGVAIVSIATN